MERIDTGVRAPGIGKQFDRIIRELMHRIGELEGRIEELKREDQEKGDARIWEEIERLEKEIERLEKEIKWLQDVRQAVGLVLKNTVDPLGVRLIKANEVLEIEKIDFRIGTLGTMELDRYSTKRSRFSVRVLTVEDYNRIKGPNEKKKREKIVMNEDPYLLVMSKVLYLSYQKDPVVRLVQTAHEKVQTLLNVIYRARGKEVPEVLQIPEGLTKADHKLITVILGKMIPEQLYVLGNEHKRRKEERTEEERWNDLKITQIDLARVEERDYKLVIKHMREKRGDFGSLCKILKEEKGGSQKVKDLADILPTISPDPRSRFIYMKRFWDAMYKLTG